MAPLAGTPLRGLVLLPAVLLLCQLAPRADSSCRPPPASSPRPRQAPFERTRRDIASHKRPQPGHVAGERDLDGHLRSLTRLQVPSKGVGCKEGTCGGMQVPSKGGVGAGAGVGAEAGAGTVAPQQRRAVQKAGARAGLGAGAGWEIVEIGAWSRAASDLVTPQPRRALQAEARGGGGGGSGLEWVAPAVDFMRSNLNATANGLPPDSSHGRPDWGAIVAAYDQGASAQIVQGMICGTNPGPGGRNVSVVGQGPGGEVPPPLLQCQGGELVAIVFQDTPIFSNLQLPDSLCALTTLTDLDLSFNHVAPGVSIPSCIGNLTNLQTLELENLGLVGSLPSSLGSLVGLDTLLFPNNSLNGPMPASLSALTSLTAIQLQYNSLSGPVPSFLSTYPGLFRLNLFNNNLSGQIPPQLGSLPGLGELRLYKNNFSGSIPTQLGQLRSLSVLNLDRTNVSGSLPDSLGQLTNLRYLHIAYNPGLKGTIPSSFNNLYSLNEVFMLANSLSGPAPACWATFPNLTSINLGIRVHCPNGTGVQCCGGRPLNDIRLPFCQAGFCGRYCDTCIVPSTPGLPAGVIAAITAVVSIVVLNILALVGYALWNAIRFRRSRSWEKDIQLCRRYTWEEIVDATGSFGQENFLGKGGFGTVYKGVLSSGDTVAVKRAARVVVGSEGKGKFEEEVLAVHNLSHKSLVRLVGYCSESRERILVYEYMAGGALSEHLFEGGGFRDPLLSFEQRLGVAVDVAEGLKYLHNFASTPLVHRDIKPENILLDAVTPGAPCRAAVADFGLARQIQPLEAHHTNIAGTTGYIDPELLSLEKVTPRADVYSFGVVLLELVTGRRAIMRPTARSRPRSNNDNNNNNINNSNNTNNSNNKSSNKENSDQSAAKRDAAFFFDTIGRDSVSGVDSTTDASATGPGITGPGSTGKPAHGPGTALVASSATEGVTPEGVPGVSQGAGGAGTSEGPVTITEGESREGADQGATYSDIVTAAGAGGERGGAGGEISVESNIAGVPGGVPRGALMGVPGGIPGGMPGGIPGVAARGVPGVNPAGSVTSVSAAGSMLQMENSTQGSLTRGTEESSMVGLSGDGGRGGVGQGWEGQEGEAEGEGEGDGEGDDGWVHISMWVEGFIERGELEAIFDPRLSSEGALPALTAVTMLAMECLGCPAVHRPGMGEVSLRLHAIQRELKNTREVGGSQGGSQGNSNSNSGSGSQGSQSQFRSASMQRQVGGGYASWLQLSSSFNARSGPLSRDVLPSSLPRPDSQSQLQSMSGPLTRPLDLSRARAQSQSQTQTQTEPPSQAPSQAQGGGAEARGLAPAAAAAGSVEDSGELSDITERSNEQ